MFVIDTNVLSETMRPAPTPSVARWVAEKPEERLFTTTICQAEIFSGISFLPPGRRRAQLQAAARGVFDVDFGGRILPFDEAAAASYVGIAASRRTAGRSVGTLDLLIAAIAQSKNATVVTRDVADFAFSGVPLINLWDEA